MVETGGLLGEASTVVAVVVVEHEDQVHGLGAEDLADTAFVRDVHALPHTEDALVPRDAGVDVGDGDRQVVQHGLGYGHATPFRIRSL